VSDTSPGSPSADTSGFPSTDVKTFDGGGIVGDVSVVPNPSNALSYYVEWPTTVPASTQLVVDCGDEWAKVYRDEENTTEHSVFIMGLWDGATCELTATSTAEEGASGMATTGIEVGPLPDFLPDLTVHTREEGSLQEGWTMLNLTNGADKIPFIAAMVDHRGRYRWYHQRSTSNQGSDTEIRPMDDGVLLGGNRTFMGPAKIDWEGDQVWSDDFPMHHDIRPGGDDDTLYYLTFADKCEQDLWSDVLVEYSRESGEKVDEWVFCDYWTPENPGDDWSHLNTNEPVPGEEAFILSSRTQHTLFKLDTAAGEIDWRMGVKGEFGLEGEDLFYRQHAPELQDNGNIVLFDNGALPGGEHTREWSRAMEISFDTETMEAEVVWEFRPDPDIFAPIWGDADRLDNGNTLVVFGVRNENADKNSRIMEVDADSQKVWDLEAPNKWGWYRADRVVDLPVGYVE
jgi:arylsulfate sulfotransferase